MLVRKSVNFRGVPDGIEANRRNPRHPTPDCHELRPYRALGLKVPNPWIRPATGEDLSILRCAEPRCGTSLG